MNITDLFDKEPQLLNCLTEKTFLKIYKNISFYTLKNYGDKIIQHAWDSLPNNIQQIFKHCEPCYEHYNMPGTTHWDGPPSLKSECYFCKSTLYEDITLYKDLYMDELSKSFPDYNPNSTCEITTCIEDLCISEPFLYGCIGNLDVLLKLTEQLFNNEKWISGIQENCINYYIFARNVKKVWSKLPDRIKEEHFKILKIINENHCF